MRKRYRAEIYESYLKMGQIRMDVDPTLYDVVRVKLAQKSLCGEHATENTEPLPPRQEKLASRRRAPLPRLDVEDSIIEEIVAEEQPSNQNWHRYLVRWSGYHPSWEAWRLPGRGSVGDPVESWEPAWKLKGTQALIRWEQASAI